MYKSKFGEKANIKKANGKKANGKKLNIGLQILRTICAFLVIVCHFYGHSKYRIIVIQNKYYVITFFYMSFYFSYNTLSSLHIPKIKERFKKMIIPYIIWPLLFYLNDKFNHYYYKKNSLYTLKDLYYQLIVGCKIYGIFWFLFNLILLTIFFTLIIFMFKKSFILVLFLFNAFIYLFFYSNYANILIFYKFKKVPCHHSIRPNLEFFVFAFTGFYLSSIQFINKLYKYRFIYMFISITCLFTYIQFYNIFFKNLNFIFDGITKDIIITFFIIIFSMLPFDKINNNYIIKFLNKITSYTGGIYYLHVKLGDFCGLYFSIIRHRHFKGCFLLYTICYLACFIGTLIFRKTSLKYLFI